MLFLMKSSKMDQLPTELRRHPDQLSETLPSTIVKVSAGILKNHTSGKPTITFSSTEDLS
jgi:hypothetical protein